MFVVGPCAGWIVDSLAIVDHTKYVGKSVGHQVGVLLPCFPRSPTPASAAATSDELTICLLLCCRTTSSSLRMASRSSRGRTSTRSQGYASPSAETRSLDIRCRNCSISINDASIIPPRSFPHGRETITGRGPSRPVAFHFAKRCR